MCSTHKVRLRTVLLSRWVHSECALSGELPETKCICLLCKEDHQQQPVCQAHTAETQTREASEVTDGHLVEMTIQTDADMTTEDQTDLSEEPGHTEMELGKSHTM